MFHINKLNGVFWNGLKSFNFSVTSCSSGPDPSSLQLKVRGQLTSESSRASQDAAARRVQSPEQNRCVLNKRGVSIFNMFILYSKTDLAPLLELGFVLQEERRQIFDRVGRPGEKHPQRQNQRMAAGADPYRGRTHLSLARTDRPCNRMGTTVWSR